MAIALTNVSGGNQIHGHALCKLDARILKMPRVICPIGTLATIGCHVRRDGRPASCQNLSRDPIRHLGGQVLELPSSLKPQEPTPWSSPNAKPAALPQDSASELVGRNVQLHGSPMPGALGCLDPLPRHANGVICASTMRRRSAQPRGRLNREDRASPITGVRQRP
jgi:hypothetical protein